MKLSGSYIHSRCKITSACNPKYCDNIVSEEDVEQLQICYNCKHWFGGGDWGLSCAKDYYNCNTNGFTPACKEFERKITL